MPAPTRIGDRETGVCSPGCLSCPHTRNGANDTGSPDVDIDDLAAHRVTDTGPCICPHGGTYESVEGSDDVEINDLPLTLVGHKTRCLRCGFLGHHIEGSPDVEIG